MIHVSCILKQMELCSTNVLEQLLGLVAPRSAWFLLDSQVSSYHIRYNKSSMAYNCRVTRGATTDHSRGYDLGHKDFSFNQTDSPYLSVNYYQSKRSTFLSHHFFCQLSLPRVLPPRLCPATWPIYMKMKLNFDFPSTLSPAGRTPWPAKGLARTIKAESLGPPTAEPKTIWSEREKSTCHKWQSNLHFQPRQYLLDHHWPTTFSSLIYQKSTIIPTASVPHLTSHSNTIPLPWELRNCFSFTGGGGGRQVCPTTSPSHDSHMPNV